MNSTGALGPKAVVDWSHYYCGYSPTEWQRNTGGQDSHSRQVTNTGADGAYSAAGMVAQARAMLYKE